MKQVMYEKLKLKKENVIIKVLNQQLENNCFNWFYETENLIVFNSIFYMKQVFECYIQWFIWK